ncbi:MAG: sigma-70 family RNA polymerase sigma factor [Planctomycetota bacterium]
MPTDPPPPNPSTDPDLQRFLRDRSDEAFARLAARCEPLIRSVCRAMLRDPGEIDEATQLTLIRLCRKADTIEGSLTAWLSVVARNACRDLQRRSASRQRVAWGVAASMPRHEDERHRQWRWRQASRRLPEALAALDDADRELLVARFFGRLPLRTLAAERGVSVPTISREVRRAADRMRGVMRALGIEAPVVDRAVPETDLDAMANEADAEYFRDLGLVSHAPWDEHAHAVQQRLETRLTHPPGWSRPLRVGLLLSQTTYRRARYGEDQINWQAEASADGTDEIEWVSLLEARTGDDPVIERTVRDYELTAGVIDLADPGDLSVLDVIVLGHAFVVLPEVARRVRDAVRGGTGLLVTGHAGAIHGSADLGLMADLMLADGPIGNHCVHLDPACTHDWNSLSCPGIVRRRHPAIPGLVPGQTMKLWPCGAVYRPKADATVIIETCEAHPPTGIRQTPAAGQNPEDQATAQLPPLPMPTLVSGHLGSGRVLVFNTSRIEHWHESHPFIAPTLKRDLLAWLAEPRRKFS